MFMVRGGSITGVADGFLVGVSYFVSRHYTQYACAVPQCEAAASRGSRLSAVHCLVQEMSWTTSAQINQLSITLSRSVHQSPPPTAPRLSSPPPIQSSIIVFSWTALRSRNQTNRRRRTWKARQKSYQSYCCIIPISIYVYFTCGCVFFFRHDTTK